jgi:hypothetical protein
MSLLPEFKYFLPYQRDPIRCNHPLKILQKSRPVFPGHLEGPTSAPINIPPLP